MTSPFSGSGDIDAEDIYLHCIQVIMKYEAVFDTIPKKVEAKDINQILRSCFNILSSLKDAFKPENLSEYARGAKLSLAATTAEEYRYPLKKEWHLLALCVKLHKQNIGTYEAPVAPQQGESSSGGKKIAVKTFLT